MLQLAAAESAAPLKPSTPGIFPHGHVTAFVLAETDTEKKEKATATDVGCSGGTTMTTSVKERSVIKGERFINMAQT